jgi:hypothetical protein
MRALLMRGPRTAAARGVVLMFSSLALASLLNAQGLRKTADIQPPGFKRTIAMAVTGVLADVSHDLYLDRPRQELLSAVGRNDEDTIDDTVQLLAAIPRAAVPVPRPARSVRVHAARRSVPRPALPVFTADKPLRVWVAGDSLAAVPGQALERLVGTKGPVDVLAVESRLSTGLGRPDLYNWFTRLHEVIGQLHPDVVVLSFGADDAHNYLSGAPSGRTIGPLGSATWNAEYRRRVDGVTRELNAAGIYVVWLGTPIPRGSGFHHSFRVVNRVIRSVVAAHPKTSAYVDEWSLLSDSHHGYSDYLPNASGHLVLMRAPDGVHLEPPAGDLIARVVLDRLQRVFDLTAKGASRNST